VFTVAKSYHNKKTASLSVSGFLFYNSKQKRVLTPARFLLSPLFEGGQGGFALISNIQANPPAAIAASPFKKGEKMDNKKTASLSVSGFLFYNIKQKRVLTQARFLLSPLFEGGQGGFALISNIQANPPAAIAASPFKKGEKMDNKKALQLHSSRAF
jgi:hypothetical protein